MREWWTTTLTSTQRWFVGGGAAALVVVAVVIGVVATAGSSDSSVTTVPEAATSSTVTETTVPVSTTTTSSTTTTTLPPNMGDATADAGEDQIAAVSSTTQLDGTGSSDPDDDELTYVWTQLRGEDATNGVGFLEGEAPLIATPHSVGTLVFELVVWDGEPSDPDEVVVHVLEEPDSAIFVDGAGGNDSNGGTMNSPLRSFDAAVAAANAGSRDIYLKNWSGRYEASGEQTSLRGGVSVYGGYGEEWFRDSTDKTPLAVGPGGLVVPVNSEKTTVSGLSIEAAGGEGSVLGLALVGDGDSEKTAVVADLDVVTGNSTGSNSDRNLAMGIADLDIVIVERVVLRPGFAGDGAHGDAGEAATVSGNPGGNANGGSPGSGAGGSPSVVRGGSGGQPGNALASKGGSGTAGGGGSAAPGVGGDPGENGGVGQGGPGGDGGVGGEGGQSTTDDLVSLLPPDGADGGSGGTGSGGGGGGGGGGLVGLTGGAGGGGGGGGQGGDGGGSGSGGGESVGLIVDNVDSLTIIDSDIAGGRGGAGGDGGIGGDATFGGPGGFGSEGACSFLGCGAGQAGDGGRGGGGGAGGRGGWGGAGSGGFSIGVWAINSSVTVTGGHIAGGRGGNGGSGGWPGNSGAAGTDGGSGGDHSDDATGPPGTGAGGGWSYAFVDASVNPGAGIRLDGVDLERGIGGEGGEGPTAGPPGVAETANFD